MDRHLRPAELEQVIEDTLAGARSLRLTGWVAEECEAAALERIARYWPDGPSDGWFQDRPQGRTAFLMGKRAAVDELRRLTRWRRTVHMREVPFETDESGDRPDLASTEGGYEAVELEDQLTRSTAKLRATRPTNHDGAPAGSPLVRSRACFGSRRRSSRSPCAG